MDATEEKGGRYTSEARFSFSGDTEHAQRLVGEARKVLGYLRDTLAGGGPELQVQRVTLPDGATIEARLVAGQYSASIFAPDKKSGRLSTEFSAPIVVTSARDGRQRLVSARDGICGVVTRRTSEVEAGYLDWRGRDGTVLVGVPGEQRRSQSDREKYGNGFVGGFARVFEANTGRLVFRDISGIIGFFKKGETYYAIGRVGRGPNLVGSFLRLYQVRRFEIDADGEETGVVEVVVDNYPIMPPERLPLRPGEGPNTDPFESTGFIFSVAHVFRINADGTQGVWNLNGHEFVGVTPGGFYRGRFDGTYQYVLANHPYRYVTAADYAFSSGAPVYVIEQGEVYVSPPTEVENEQTSTIARTYVQGGTADGFAVFVPGVAHAYSELAVIAICDVDLRFGAFLFVELPVTETISTPHSGTGGADAVSALYGLTLLKYRVNGVEITLQSFPTLNESLRDGTGYPQPDSLFQAYNTSPFFIHIDENRSLVFVGDGPGHFGGLVPPGGDTAGFTSRVYLVCGTTVRDVTDVVVGQIDPKNPPQGRQSVFVSAGFAFAAKIFKETGDA